MGKARSREVRRTATRKPQARSLVSSGPPSAARSHPAAEGLGGDVDVAVRLDAATIALLEAIAEARSPLAAELVLCRALGVIELGLRDDVDMRERLEAVALMLGEMIVHAEALATEDALALLRVCSVLGPAASRDVACEGAGRLASTGVADRPWAGMVGRPEMLRAWCYGDVFGAQSSVGALFDYRGREHALMVLVDHQLGGGVKDCWVSEGRAARGMRNSVAAAMANDEETFFEDIDAGAAAVLLGSALARTPCPEQLDQILDVADYLDLLRARTEHLARLAGTLPD
jgi:hypothetical protein